MVVGWGWGWGWGWGMGDGGWGMGNGEWGMGNGERRETLQIHLGIVLCLRDDRAG